MDKLHKGRNLSARSGRVYARNDYPSGSGEAVYHLGVMRPNGPAPSRIEGLTATGERQRMKHLKARPLTVAWLAAWSVIGVVWQSGGTPW